MPGIRWNEWFPRREIDTGPEAAEALRLSCEYLLTARFQSSEQILDERKHSPYGASVASLLGYYGNTNAHLEVLKSSLRTGIARHEHLPYWAGKYSLRPLPPAHLWPSGEPLILTSLANPAKNVWELRYGYHPDAQFVDPGTGSVVPRPELHANTYGTLALSSDLSRTSLLRFWFTRHQVSGRDLLALMTHDPLVQLHAKVMSDTRENNFRSIHYSIDVDGMISDILNDEMSVYAHPESRIVRSQVPRHVQVMELCRLKSAHETWYVYSGAQSQFAHKPATSPEAFPEVMTAVAVR